MLKKLIYVAGAAAMLAMSSVTFAQGTPGARPYFHQDRHEMRADARGLRAGRRDLRGDRGALRDARSSGNWGAAHAQRRDMRRDHRGMRSARRDRRHDMGFRRADRRGLRHGRFAHRFAG